MNDHITTDCVWKEDLTQSAQYMDWDNHLLERMVWHVNCCGIVFLSFRLSLLLSLFNLFNQYLLVDLTN